jgi:hypothetical protein
MLSSAGFAIFQQLWRCFRFVASIHSGSGRKAPLSKSLPVSPETVGIFKAPLAATFRATLVCFPLRTPLSRIWVNRFGDQHYTAPIVEDTATPRTDLVLTSLITVSFALFLDTF